MDWSVVWQILKAVLAFGAMLLAVATTIAIWRLQGILNWKRSLRNELNDLNNKAELANEIQQQAIKVVLDRCQRIWRATSLEIREILEISSYIRSIASCYHPDVEKPELCMSIGHCLNSAQEVTQRLELILRRPGFQRLQRVRIRHIRQYYEWYDRVNKYWFVQYLIRYHMVIKRLFQLRLIILPDPFSWLAYFSNRLTMLTLTRCLLLDIYLFMGKMAIQASDEQKKEDAFSTENGELEKTLEDLDSLKPSEPDINDPRIQEIRNRLVGFPSMVISTPGLKDWKKAVNQTANIIAKKYFPESAQPMEEVVIGALLARSRIWIKSMCETETLPVVKRLHRVRIDSLINIKSFTDIYLPSQVRILIKKSWDMYGWIKWPLKVYRWVKRGSPAGIAIDVGWVVAKRGFINFVCRHTFDMAYKELEMVYSQSRSTE
jgi:hypothetical protein